MIEKIILDTRWLADKPICVCMQTSQLMDWKDSKTAHFSTKTVKIIGLDSQI